MSCVSAVNLFLDGLNDWNVLNYWNGRKRAGSPWWRVWRAIALDEASAAVSLPLGTRL